MDAAQTLPAWRWERGHKSAQRLRGGTTHPPGLPLRAELAGSPVHLPRPSPASCCAFEVVEDKINSPKWRLWLAALGERGVPEVGAEREQLGLLLMEK